MCYYDIYMVRNQRSLLYKYIYEYTRDPVHGFVGSLSLACEDQAKTCSPTSPEGSWIVRGCRPSQETLWVHNRGRGGMQEVGQPDRDCGRAPGRVWPVLLSPDWLDPSSKLTYQLEHLPRGGQCMS